MAHIHVHVHTNDRKEIRSKIENAMYVYGQGLELLMKGEKKIEKKECWNDMMRIVSGLS